MVRFSLLCLSLTLGAGCLPVNRTATDPAPPVIQTVERLGLADDPTNTATDTLIVLERTACYGSCPVYEVSVDAEGRVLYNGMYSVARVGTATDSVGRDVLEQLLSAFENAGYADLPEDDDRRCLEFWTDQPGAITAVRLGSYSKRLDHYHGCKGFHGEEELTRLENEIDRLLVTERWVKGTQ